MDAKLTELKALLNRQIALHEGLQEALQQEAARDGTLDSAALVALQQTKHQVVHDIQQLEAQRLGLVAEIAKLWGEKPADLTLRRIAGRAPAPLGPELGECHARLLALVADIRSTARQTGANSRARLKAIDATLAIIGEAARLHPTYSGEGRLQKLTPTFKQTSA